VFKTDLRQIVHALSDMLDLVGIDELHHSKRVAFMSFECSKLLNMSTEELDTVYDASLLHDCGVSSTQTHKHLISEMDWSDSEEHCSRGHNLLDEQDLFRNIAPIILYHHTHWDTLQTIDITHMSALISNCIYMTDRVDALMEQNKNQELLITRDNIRNTIKKYRGSLFAPELVDVFLDVSQSEFFWLTMMPHHLELHLSEMSNTRNTKYINDKSLLQIANIFASIVDAKSHYTVEHSRGVARLAKHIASELGMNKEKCIVLEVAGLLHDIGKLKIPDEILEKPGPLTPAERAIIMSHSFESYQILKPISGFDDISKWAAFHHECISGKGYPFHLHREQLPREARIIAIADVFQALVQERPYRSSVKPKKVQSILEEMESSNKLDSDLVAFVNQNLESCWQAAIA
jgi:putative nucleotidyltransferase with HDIG domain